MQTGAVLPQHELGPDVAVLRDYAQTVQDLGYDFIVASENAGVQSALCKCLLPLDSPVRGNDGVARRDENQAHLANGAKLCLRVKSWRASRLCCAEQSAVM